MKKVFSTLSAILLACTCLMPGLAWADEGPSLTLSSSGALKAENAGEVHSALIEVQFSGTGADKVIDVALEGAPSRAMASTVYDAVNRKATIAVSAGADALALTDGSLGTLDVFADGASANTPVTLQAKLVSFIYIDSADSAAPAEDGSFSVGVVDLVSYDSTPPVKDDTPTPNDDSTVNNDDRLTTLNYPANRTTSPTQAGQSGANTPLTKTGDIVLISAIALGVAAVVVLIAMTLVRKKGSARRR